MVIRLGPALRPSSAFTHRDGVPPHWRWNFDHRLEAEFKPFNWSPKHSLPRPQTSLLDIQDKWTRVSAFINLDDNFSWRKQEIIFKANN